MSFHPSLKPGEELSNAELRRIFKCSSQGGMRRSLKTNTLVIVSDHTKSFYEDRWKGNILHYTGMGLTGDQSLTFSQNKTLNESRTNGVNVHLFEVFEKGKYVYQGPVELGGRPYRETQPDHEGNNRIVWMFPLKLVQTGRPPMISEETFENDREIRERAVRKLSDKELHERISRPTHKKTPYEVFSNRIMRNEYVSEFVKRRAKGKCQLCGNDAPFYDRCQQPCLEVHHITWLSRGGKDEIDNAVALCPNCHRKMHILDLQSDRDHLLSCARKNS